MSSKLHRGGISTEPIAWHNVAPTDPPALEEHVYPQASGQSGQLAPDVDLRIRTAYQKGLQEGQEAATRDTEARLDAMQGRLARTIEELSGLRPRFRHEAEEDVVALSLAIARRVLHRELTMDPDALLGLVKAALEKMEAREVHRVRVRPEDAPRYSIISKRWACPSAWK